jgi:hypothetical protein
VVKQGSASTVISGLARSGLCDVTDMPANVRSYDLGSGIVESCNSVDGKSVRSCQVKPSYVIQIK